MKTIIIYYSKHHGNTKKLLDSLTNVELVNILEKQPLYLNDYDIIGIASGIYYENYHQSIIQYIKDHLPAHKKVFCVHTAGLPRINQDKVIKKLVVDKNSKHIGTFCCVGYDTFGPLKLIGGLGKGHPNNDDISNFLQFYKSLVNKYESD